MDLKQRVEHHLSRTPENKELTMVYAYILQFEGMLDRLDREEEEERFPVGYESCMEICSQLGKALGSELRADEENGSITVYAANNPNLFAYCKDFSEANDLLRDISQSEMVSFLISPNPAAALIYWIRRERARKDGIPE